MHLLIFINLRTFTGEGLEPSTQVGVSIVVLWIWTLLCFLRVDDIGFLTEAVAIFHILSMAIIIIALLIMSEKISSPSFVFEKFYNNTGSTNNVYVTFIGLATVLFAFIGYEV